MCRTGRRQNRHFGNLGFRNGFLNCCFFSFSVFRGRGGRFGFGNNCDRFAGRDKDRLAARRQGFHKGGRRRGFRHRSRERHFGDRRKHGFLCVFFFCSRFFFFGFFDFFLD
jgi:hypothetical protein